MGETEGEGLDATAWAGTGKLSTCARASPGPAHEPERGSPPAVSTQLDAPCMQAVGQQAAVHFLQRADPQKIRAPGFQ